MSVDLGERCYAMDVLHPMLVVGTAGRQIHVIKLQNPGTLFKVRSLQQRLRPELGPY